jgi:hypothetical protein
LSFRQFTLCAACATIAHGNLGDVKMRVWTWALGAALHIGATTSCVAWASANDEDALTDQKVAIISEVAPGGVGLVAKCWEGGELQVGLILPMPWRPGADYKAVVDVVIRADKNEPIKTSWAPRELSGKFALFDSDDTPNITPLAGGVVQVLRAIRDAKSRVVVGVAGAAYTFPVAGSLKAVTAFAARCKLNLDTKLTD